MDRSVSCTPAGKPSNHLAVPGTTRKVSSRSFSASSALAACSPSPEPAKPPVAKGPASASSNTAAAAHDDAIAWRKDDVDAAFVQAKADHKPLFLYWGAVWCPPCNQVKATLFNRQD